MTNFIFGEAFSFADHHVLRRFAAVIQGDGHEKESWCQER